MIGKWVECRGYWREIFDVLKLEYKINCSPHDKVWGYWVCPERGISQISEGSPVSLEHEEMIFNPNNRTFSPAPKVKDETAYMIYFYDNMCQIVLKDKLYAFDILRPYTSEIFSNIVRINQGEHWDIYMKDNNEARQLFETLTKEIYNSRLNSITSAKIK